MVHDHVSVSGQNDKVQEATARKFALSMSNHQSEIVQADILSLEDDPVAKILWDLDPSTLEEVILAMVVSPFPL